MSGTSRDKYIVKGRNLDIFKPFMLKDNSGDKDIIIKGLTFHRTCSCSPEQYDVFDNNNNVGYIRLRWGELTCEYPDVGGEEIYHAEIGDEWTGMFENDIQRQLHLLDIAEKILEKINT